MIDFTLPSLGADMESALFVAWKVAPGQRVGRGDVVCEVETQKGVVDVEIWEAGEVVELVAEPGQRVAVGAVLARLEPDDGPASPPGPPVVAGAPLDKAPSLPPVMEPEAGRPPAAADMRRAIAAAMSRSKREIPHYYVGHELRVDKALDWLEARNRRVAVDGRVLFAAVLLRACALALRESPSLNGHFVDGAHQPSGMLHLGVATALRGGGLVAPAIRDADRMGLDAMMARLRDVLGRARDGGLRASELGVATITVTALGDLGVQTVWGVIHPPQVALVGLGRVLHRPWVEEGRVVAARVLHATVSGDHRVSDGLEAARFLNALDAVLQTPETLP